MESSITIKIKNFTIDPKYAASYEKFIGCLSDTFVSMEEFNQILELLNSKAIVIKKPSQFSIFANGYDYIRSLVENYENLNCLQLLVDNPLRINNKEAINRLTYLINSNIPYLDEKGKCIKEVYNNKLFNSKYPNAIKEEQTEQDATFAFTENPADTPVVFETPEDSNTLVDPMDLIVDNIAPAVDDAPVVENEINTLGTGFVSEIPVIENNPVIEEPTNLIVDNSVPVIDEAPVIEPTPTNTLETSLVNDIPVMDTPVVEDDIVNNVVDPIAEILSKPQTIALDDETFDRYDSLAESIRQVLCRVYNVTELNDNIIDNLIKLVTNGVEDDKLVMYTAITFGKNVSEEEKMCLTKAIEEELDYTSIMNIGLGRVA